MTVRPLLLGLMLLTNTPVSAQNAAAERVIDKAVEAYASVKSARATFEQTIKNALVGSNVTSRGSFEQSRPDRFAFRFTDPAGDVILSDGKFVWLYLPSSTPGQVIKAPLTADLEGSIDLIGAFFSNPRKRYAIADAGESVIGGRTTRSMTLTPKDGSASFTKARVWIDVENGMLKQFEANESNGIVRTVRILTFEPVATLPTSSFRFSPPKGVKVVNRSQLQ